MASFQSNPARSGSACGSMKLAPVRYKALMVSSSKELEWTRQRNLSVKAVPVWALSLPLPAIVMISVGIYMIVLAAVLWCHHCLKAKCDPQCSDCCAGFSPCEYCLVCAQSCDCRPPSMRSCLDYSCPSPNCAMWDCACTCQPPECDSINCFCFEIKFK
ncbi:uncharacterized protein si:ch211-198p11.6 [Megalobrama amblycephala]|uniref:uncharacterized protein si:ch211-198p11.6 n=1 Tax=Megalobrama amblycephala TaxID=75352 RepID=UPI00201479E9|nr:uncharacterized protein si:ch211-198p11.6 [Megalobrama amblycephala]